MKILTTVEENDSQTRMNVKLWMESVIRTCAQYSRTLLSFAL